MIGDVVENNGRNDRAVSSSFDAIIGLQSRETFVNSLHDSISKSV